jgi:hypothetical protein
MTKIEKVTFRITPELLNKLDDLRRAEQDIPSRGTMLCRLIERATVEEPMKAPKPRGKK